MKTIVLIVGARPNFMKAYPVYKKLEQYFKLVLIHTGQHFDDKMSKVFFEQLGFPKPDIHLKLNSNSRGGIYDNKLYIENHEYLEDIENVIKELKECKGDDLGQIGEIRDKIMVELKTMEPELVIVFGDVTSTLSASLAADMLGIKIAHVESGLRSFDITMPEEVNRMIVDKLSSYLFVTESSGVTNLRNERLDNGNIFMVGNTMTECLLEFVDEAAKINYNEELGFKKGDYILVTLHRPSNVDNKTRLLEICEELILLAEKINVIFPIHPRTRRNLTNWGMIEKMNKIIMCDPIGYLEFICLQKNAKYVIVDSGGIQEETSAINVPCFTIRDNTERPSTLIEHGGTNTLIKSLSDIRANEITYSSKYIDKDAIIPSIQIAGILIKKLYN